jgi:exonuclease SbcD
MKVLHTSDWHLGRSLYGKKRYQEFSAFLDWLAQTIEQQGIDLLLVAGDIFDTSTPSNRAQQLYYRFLCRVAESACRHVVLIAGNHDSPSFLEASKTLLQSLNVYVVGAASDCVKDEVLVLYQGDIPQAIVCAVPYLRDKDLRKMEPGETSDEKSAKLIAGLKQHYLEVVECAEQTRNKLNTSHYLPIIGMGHLFAAGSVTVDGDGVRELYVGSLARVCADIFPSSLDYVALGHLHVPQLVGDCEHIRYCGSPLPMGFGEAEQQKLLVVVEFTGKQRCIHTLNVPRFQDLQRIVGDQEHIHQQIELLKGENSQAWLEIEFTGQTRIANLRESLDEALQESSLEVRRISNRRVVEKLIQECGESQSLDELNAHEVFSRCLDARK